MLRAIKVAGVFLGLLVLNAPGCYSRGDGWAHTGGPQVYYSTELMPTTVSLVDTRTQETIWSIDIPPLKQLVMKFQEGKGDDPVYTPDLLEWDVLEMGKLTGKLRNSITVPPPSARMVDMSIRPGIEYAQADPKDVLRTDDPEDRPAWWSPEGGQAPDNNPVEEYDD